MEPTQLGRYVISKVLGKGAMGVVYLSRDPVIGRQIALKTLAVPADSPEESDEFQQRFLREAQAAGILTHPGIVTVHDAGVDEATGLSFIAMELVEGKSLKDLLKESHPFTFSEVARIGSTIASALDYAHSKGVVHRDVKPANILLTPQGHPKITDFGVARLEASNLTATGQFIGTPNYMSPEQVIGDPVTGRSDLFSLGVVLFELLTGSRPFTGSSLTEITYKIVNSPAPIPSQLRLGLPPAFNPILLKLLEKDPAKRYATGAEVGRALDALARVLSGGQGQPRPASAPAVSSAAPIGEAPDDISSPGTATSATVHVTREPPRPPSIWRLPIAGKWVAMLLAIAIVPTALVSGWLALRVDRGPFFGSSADEVARRRQVALAVQQASRALDRGDALAAQRLLSQVWDQAPHSDLARSLKGQADLLADDQRQRMAREASSQRLREEGRELLRQQRWREARSRFEQALALTPDDPLAQEFLELARERARSPGVARPLPPQVIATPTPAPTPIPIGTARLDVYFNSPLSAGTVELHTNGEPLAAKAFDFSERGFLGVRRRQTGVFQDSFSVSTAVRSVLVRLKGEDGSVVGEQNLAVVLVPGGRYMLKIDMDSPTAVPRFSVSEIRGR